MDQILLAPPFELILNFTPKGMSREEIKAFFAPFGELYQDGICFSTNSKKKSRLSILYKTAQAALKAYSELNDKRHLELDATQRLVLTYSKETRLKLTAMGLLQDSNYTKWIPPVRMPPGPVDPKLCQTFDQSSYPKNGSTSEKTLRSISQPLHSPTQQFSTSTHSNSDKSQRALWLLKQRSLSLSTTSTSRSLRTVSTSSSKAINEPSGLSQTSPQNTKNDTYVPKINTSKKLSNVASSGESHQHPKDVSQHSIPILIKNLEKSKSSSFSAVLQDTNQLNRPRLRPPHSEMSSTVEHHLCKLLSRAEPSDSSLEPKQMSQNQIYAGEFNSSNLSFNKTSDSNSNNELNENINHFTPPSLTQQNEEEHPSTQNVSSLTMTSSLEFSAQPLSSMKTNMSTPEDSLNEPLTTFQHTNHKIQDLGSIDQEGLSILKEMKEKSASTNRDETVESHVTAYHNIFCKTPNAIPETSLHKTQSHNCVVSTKAPERDSESKINQYICKEQEDYLTLLTRGDFQKLCTNDFRSNQIKSLCLIPIPYKNAYSQLFEAQQLVSLDSGSFFTVSNPIHYCFSIEPSIREDCWGAPFVGTTCPIPQCFFFLPLQNSTEQRKEDIQ